MKPTPLIHINVAMSEVYGGKYKELHIFLLMIP